MILWTERAAEVRLPGNKCSLMEEVSLGPRLGLDVGTGVPS